MHGQQNVKKYFGILIREQLQVCAKFKELSIFMFVSVYSYMYRYSFCFGIKEYKMD